MRRLERLALVACLVWLPLPFARALDVVPSALRLVVDESVPAEDRIGWRDAGAIVVVRPTRSSAYRAPFLARVLRSADEVELELPLAEPVVQAVRALEPSTCRVSLVGTSFTPADRVALDRLGPCRLRLTLTAWDVASAERWPAHRGPVRLLLASLPPIGELARESDHRWLVVVPPSERRVATGALGEGLLRVGASVMAAGLDSATLDRLEESPATLASVVVQGLPDEVHVRRLRALTGELEWRLPGKLDPKKRAAILSSIPVAAPGTPRTPDDSELDAPLRRLPLP